MIQPSSTIKSSMTRAPTSVARRTAVYFRFGTTRETSSLRHSSGRTLARRLRGGSVECMMIGGRSGEPRNGQDDSTSNDDQCKEFADDLHHSLPVPFPPQIGLIPRPVWRLGFRS